jgi:hypothetical protein
MSSKRPVAKRPDPDPATQITADPWLLSVTNLKTRRF